MRYSNGFTLIEMMMVLAMFSIVLGITYSLMFQGEGGWLNADTKIETQQDARRAIDWMVRELRGSSSSRCTLNNNSRITFQVAEDGPDVGDIAGNVEAEWGNSIIYTLNGNQIIRTEGMNMAVLANNVQTLNFFYVGGNQSLIGITVQAVDDSLENINFQTTLQSSVHLRN